MRLNLILYFWALSFSVFAQNTVNTFTLDGELEHRIYLTGVTETWEDDAVGNIKHYERGLSDVPNLAISTTLPDGTVAELGSTITFPYTNTNSAVGASANAGGHWVRIYGVVGDVLNGSEEPLESEFYNSLDAGESIPDEFEIDIPLNANFTHLIIKTDAGNQIGELTEIDNTVAITINLYGCFFDVDLVVTTPDECAEGVGVLSAQIQGGSANDYEYLWSTGETDEAITGIHSQEYHVTVTDDNGCVAFGNTFVNGIPDAPLEVEFSLNHDNSIGTVNPTGGTPPYAYEWSDGYTEQSRTVQSGDNFNITVRDANGCFIIVMTGIIELIVTNVEDVKSVFPLNIYPNPTSGIVRASTDATTLKKLHIMDANGRIVKVIDFNVPSGMEYVFDVSLLPQGVYLLAFFNSENRATVKRLILQK